MKRAIEASTLLRASVERAREVLLGDPGVVVADRVNPEERLARTFHTTLTIRGSSGAVEHDVVLALQTPETHERALSLPVSWHATGHTHLLPAFEGELAVSGDELGSMLTLRGVYTVPLGLLGWLGERLGGKRLATRSLVAFVEQSARRLDAEVARRTAAVSWHPSPYPVSIRDNGSPHQS